MKYTLFRILACSALLAAPASSQTINWGSAVFSNLADSNGVTLDNSYIFELGAFDPGFDPTPSNVWSWRSNWNVFDRAGYNVSEGYFTGTTTMTDQGLSTSPWLAAHIPSFEGLDAYIWIRKGDTPVPTSEWLVVHAANWVFPTAIPGCCDNGLPYTWSVTNLTTETPKWGNQEGVQGPGEYTQTGSQFTLQTYTFVPEPASALLALLGAAPLVLRRRLRA